MSPSDIEATIAKAVQHIADGYEVVIHGTDGSIPKVRQLRVRHSAQTEAQAFHVDVLLDLNFRHGVR